MSTRFFLDTNLFVCSLDGDQPEKQTIALALITDTLQSGNGIISTQVVQEFLNVALRKYVIP
jgi:predicted nucleic acid-binding protein